MNMSFGVVASAYVPPTYVGLRATLVNTFAQWGPISDVTIPNVNIGPEYTDRELVIFVLGSTSSGNSTIQTVSINGTGMTYVDRHNAMFGVSVDPGGIWRLPVPTGTTMSLNIHVNNTPLIMAVIYVWAVRGGINSHRPLISGSGTNTSITMLSTEVGGERPIPVGGIALHAAWHPGASANPPNINWTNAVERNEFDYPGDNFNASAAESTVPGTYYIYVTFPTGNLKYLYSVILSPAS